MKSSSSAVRTAPAARQLQAVQADGAATSTPSPLRHGRRAFARRPFGPPLAATGQNGVNHYKLQDDGLAACSGVPAPTTNTYDTYYNTGTGTAPCTWTQSDTYYALLVDPSSAWYQFYTHRVITTDCPADSPLTPVTGTWDLPLFSGSIYPGCSLQSSLPPTITYPSASPVTPPSTAPSPTPTPPPEAGRVGDR